MHSPVQLGASTDCLYCKSLNVYLTTNQRQLVSEYQRTEIPSTVTRLEFASISATETVQKRGASRWGERVLTLSHEVPPRCVQRVVHTPPADTRAVGRTGVVLVHICGTKRGLPIERGEGADVTPPPAYRQSTRCLFEEPQLWLTCERPRCRMSEDEMTEACEIG